jgi:hypothetical protein
VRLTNTHTSLAGKTEVGRVAGGSRHDCFGSPADGGHYESLNCRSFLPDYTMDVLPHSLYDFSLYDLSK